MKEHEKLCSEEQYSAQVSKTFFIFALFVNKSLFFGWDVVLFADGNKFLVIGTIYWSHRILKCMFQKFSLLIIISGHKEMPYWILK